MCGKLLRSLNPEDCVLILRQQQTFSPLRYLRLPMTIGILDRVFVMSQDTESSDPDSAHVFPDYSTQHGEPWCLSWTIPLIYDETLTRGGVVMAALSRIGVVSSVRSSTAKSRPISDGRGELEIQFCAFATQAEGL